jgi:enterochelin esterase family protein
VLLRLADPDGRYTSVRLSSDLPPYEFARRNGEWRLQLDAPVERLEYQLEVVNEDGDTEHILDPGNPHRAPGAFGEKSVALQPTYAPPAWLEAPHVEGVTETIVTPGRDFGGGLEIEVWRPAGTEPDEPLPLLVAHDGPEYDRLANLTRFCAAKIHAGELPPHRVALLPPGERNEWYSASARYTRALIERLLPAVADEPPVAVGASLGALALVHAERRHPGTFRALFLQSGFFMPRYDAHEIRFPYYHRVVGFVSGLQRAKELALPPTVLTCGAAEENIHNNREMAETLQAPLHELTDTHNYTAWRDAFEPHLTELLQRAW